MLNPLFALLLSVLVATAGETLIPPLEAIQNFGAISVSDGSSTTLSSRTVLSIRGHLA